jgi:hypothetical protein
MILNRGPVIFFLLFTASLMRTKVASCATDTFLIHTDYPTLNKEKNMLLDVYYSSDSAFTGMLNVRFYKYADEADSLLVLDIHNYKVAFKKGTNKTRINFATSDSVTYNTMFYEVLKRTGGIAPGSYKIIATVKKREEVFQTVYYREADSLLSATSPVRQDINKSLEPKSKSFLGITLKNRVDHMTSSGAGKALANASNKVNKTARKRGLRSVHSEHAGKSYIDLFYEDWFAGRYEIKSNGSLQGQISQQENKAGGATGSLTSNNMDHPSLFSQFKAVSKEKKDKDEINGDISLSTNFSNGQEQYSAVNDNYYEIRGHVEMPVCNMPVEIEGLYTSQDENRAIKSSYFRIHYDVDKVKDELRKTISSYNTKFSETKAKGAGMEQIYSSSISNLESQKAILQNELNAETSTKNLTGGQFVDSKLEKSVEKNAEGRLKDSAAARQSQTSATDSGSTAVPSTGKTEAAEVTEKEASAKKEVADKEKRIEEKRKKIEALNKKIDKIKTLLAQYRNTNHFDSTLGYDKTKSIDNQGETSYKQMVKKSASILPDGQAKSFVAGITTMDAGIFPKNQSQYTMAGQQLKGLDFGYDIGFCETGVTVGKIQYVGMDGSLDKYTCYSARAIFKPSKIQKVSFIYYGYTADRNMVSGDNFFKNADISAPSFFEPVHIISTTYDADLTKYIKVGAEVAASMKSAQQSDDPSYSLYDKTAYHVDVDGRVPNTAISLQSSYENTGKGFVNNTLPVSLAGTDRLKLAGKDDFFKSFLTAGIEYDRLSQHNFSSNSNNTKWGFDIKTNSKRYPNVALSYKPFTTFATYTDTLNVPQRPLIGSVTTGKITYQVKMHQRSLRFSLLYNKSTSSMDTVRYGTTLAQASCIYTDKKWTSSVSVGSMQLTGTTVATVTGTPNNTDFLSMSATYTLNKQTNVSGGQDFAVAGFGFCRYSINGGVMYTFKKSPFSVRVNVRYNTYELNEGDSWTKLYSGNIDMRYKIKAKAVKKNNFN